MGKDHIIVIRLKNGSEYSYRKPYNYFDKGIIIKNLESAKENDVVVFRLCCDKELLIPKSNIQLVRLILVNSDE